jgi:hypothetical protein
MMSHEGVKLIKDLRRSHRIRSHIKRDWGERRVVPVTLPRAPNLLPMFLVVLGIALMSRK